MRQSPIGPLPDWFVSYLDGRGRYTEVNFERKKDALAFLKRLERNKTEGELWTRTREFPEAKK